MATGSVNTSDVPWAVTVDGGKSTVESQVSQNEKKKFRKMYLAAGACLTFGIALGMASAYSATATVDMTKPYSSIHPTNNEVSWIGSILALGALTGGLIAGNLSQSFGRKGTLLIGSVPFLIGWLFIAYAPTVTFVYIGRFITGICVGIVCVTTPAYLVEISTPEVRGLLGASFQLFVVIGVLLVTALGAVLHWQWLAVASAVVSTVALIVMTVMPESPRWLISRGKYEEAVRSVSYLQGDFVDASAECVSIDEDLRMQPKGDFTLEEFLKPSVYKPALLSFALVFFQQACGSNAILFYTVQIFQDASDALDSNSASIITDAVLVLATAVSTGLMDKVGRKILLVISGMGMAVSLGIFGGYEFAKFHHPGIASSYDWVPLVCLPVYIAAFSVGFGPITWLMMAEITPVRFRSVIGGAATAVCWGCVFLVTKTFEGLEAEIHDYGAYWLYAGFSLLSCVFAWFFLPETKGKPFDEIQEFFSSKRTTESTDFKYHAMT